MSKPTGTEIIAWAQASEVAEALPEYDESERQGAIAGISAKRVEQVKSALAHAVYEKQRAALTEYRELGALAARVGAPRVAEIKPQYDLARGSVEFGPFSLLLYRPGRITRGLTWEGQRDIVKERVFPHLNRHKATTATRVAGLLLRGSYAAEYVKGQVVEDPRAGSQLRAVTFMPSIIPFPSETVEPVTGILTAEQVHLASQASGGKGVGEESSLYLIELIRNAVQAKLVDPTSTD